MAVGLILQYKVVERSLLKCNQTAQSMWLKQKVLTNTWIAELERCHVQKLSVVGFDDIKLFNSGNVGYPV